MQKITIIGRLGRDAAIRETQDGGKVVSFTVAVNGRYRGTEKTSWYEVSTFNYERYKNMLKYLTKGSSVIVVGELDADLDKGKDGVTRCRRSIIADSIEFNSNSTSGGTATTTTAEKTSSKSEVEVPEDDAVVTRRKPTPKAAEPVPEEYSEDGDNAPEDDLPF